MEPTINDGQWVLMERKYSLGVQWSPNKYDVVAVRHDDGDLLVKRVIGVPGDTVRVESGYIFINNKKEPDGKRGSGRICFHLVDPDTDIAWRTVYQDSNSEVIPAGVMWVIGDDRAISHFGTHPLDKIEGKVIAW